MKTEQDYALDLDDMASSAFEEAMNFGISQDSFLRLAKQVDAARAPLLSRIAELEAKLGEVEKDAKRYQWLKKALHETDGSYFIGVDTADHPGEWALSEEAADAAIDAAMGDE